MPVAISAQDLIKTYTFHQQSPGLFGSLKSVVKRRYQTNTAVDRIALAIHSGEVVGLLGPNGAGKTTTLKMLSGLLYPTSGELSVLGLRPSDRKPDYLRQISLVMGQKSMLWWDVPAMDSLLLHKDMYDLSNREFEESVSELAGLLDVEDLLHVQVRKTSLGQRMKLELLAALLHRPAILFLDEPTIGLDVVSKARVRTFLAEINQRRGTTIVLTSHDIDDIEALCERVLIIDHGRIQYDGGLAELVRRSRPRKRIRATYAEPVLDFGGGSGPWAECTLDGEDPHVLTLEVEREQTPEVLESLSTRGALVDLDVTDADVEEIIRELFGGYER